MFRSAVLFIVLIAMSTVTAGNAAAQDWKGPPDPRQFLLGAMTGLGIVDSSAGFALLGTASRKIVEPGFVPDINNPVSLETVVGPIFVNSTTAFAYSVHLRWDFEKDPSWTFYAIGGLGGNVVDFGAGTRAAFHPRFGVGAFWTMTPVFRWRAEISHEWITVGAAFPL